MRIPGKSLGLGLAFALGLLGSLAAGADPRWRQLPLSGGPIWSIAPAPSDPRVVYAVTLAAGLFRSDDGGKNWVSPSAAAAERGFGRVTVSPTNPREVSLTATQLFYPYFGRSHDGGVTWERVTVGPAGVEVREVAYDPVDPTRQYARTFGGLYRSTDGGRSWQTLAFAGSRVNRLYIDPLNPERLFALVAPVAAANLYLSEDGGATWVEKISSEFLDGFIAFAVDPVHRKIYVTLGIDLRVSGDDGATWQEPEGSRWLTGLTDLAVTPSGALLAASYYGIERSEDQGETFAPLRTLDSINKLVAGSDGTVWAAADSGIWRSADDGETWSRSHRGVTAQFVTGLAASGGPEPTLLAAGKGLFRSTSDGASWSRVPRVSGIGFFNPYFPPDLLVFSPRDPRLVFAVFASGVFRSPDGGATWRQISPLRGFALGYVESLRLAFAFDPNDARKVYFFAGFEGPLDSPRYSFSFYSTDGGINWRRRFRTPELVSAAVDPHHSDTLIGATAGGLLRSDDRGIHWRPIATEVAKPTQVVFDPRGSVYVGTTSSGVWASRDGGATFRPLGRGLDGARIVTLLADPSRPGRLFAAVPRRGVFVWDHRATHWRRLAEGLPTVQFENGLIALDPSTPGALYAATWGRGVYRLDLGDL